MHSEVLTGAIMGSLIRSSHHRDRAPPPTSNSVQHTSGLAPPLIHNDKDLILARTLPRRLHPLLLGFHLLQSHALVPSAAARTRRVDGPIDIAEGGGEGCDSAMAARGEVQ